MKVEKQTEVVLFCTNYKETVFVSSQIGQLYYVIDQEVESKLN